MSAKRVGIILPLNSLLQRRAVGEGEENNSESVRHPPYALKKY